jgi:hypothetical protein
MSNNDLDEAIGEAMRDSTAFLTAVRELISDDQLIKRDGGDKLAKIINAGIGSLAHERYHRDMQRGEL